MNRVTVRMGALAALSAMLLGCASAPPVNDATLLSDTLQKGKGDGSTTSRPVGVPANIDETVKQAQAQRRSGDFPAAAHTLSQLVLFAPDNARVLGEYGKTLIAMGRSDDALAFLERAVELQPKDWSLFSAQGVAYDQKGDYLAAQAAYGRALVLKPGDPTVLSNAALSHVQTGDLDGAETLLMQASPYGAEFPQIVSNLALVRGLKNSRPPQATAVAAPKEFAPVPSPTQAQLPSPPDTPVAAVPMPEPIASDISMIPQPANVAEMPAEGTMEPAATASALEQLQMDPSVLVQPLPSRRPEPVAKPKPTGVRSSGPSDALKGEPVLHMRPTPDDDNPTANRPKPGNARDTGSKAALDSGTHRPLVLRPALADPPATLEASARR